MREYITCYFQERTIRFGFSLFLGSTEFSTIELFSDSIAITITTKKTTATINYQHPKKIIIINDNGTNKKKTRQIMND